MKTTSPRVGHELASLQRVFGKVPAIIILSGQAIKNLYYLGVSNRLMENMLLKRPMLCSNKDGFVHHYHKLVHRTDPTSTQRIVFTGFSSMYFFVSNIKTRLESYQIESVEEIWKRISRRLLQRTSGSLLNTAQSTVALSVYFIYSRILLLLF